MKKNLQSLLWALLLSCLMSAAAYGAVVPFSPTWDYSSMDSVDYRTFSGGNLTFDISGSLNVARTFPPLYIPKTADFTISILYSDYIITGTDNNTSKLIISCGGISINWLTNALDPVKGEMLTGNISMWRTTLFGNSQQYSSIYGINNNNYVSVVEAYNMGTADQRGKLYINKSGNIITTGVVNQSGLSYSWQYDMAGIYIPEDNFWIGIDASNGPYNNTSVTFSSLDVTAVPIPLPALLLGTGLAVLGALRKKIGRGTAR